MKYVVGIDCGTTNVKAVLFDENGNEVFIKSVENKPEYSGTSIAEMDMKITWEKTASVIKQLVEEGPADKNSIEALGITAQGEGLWLIDADGNPVQNAILWCDGRAADVVANVKESPSGKIIHKITGTDPQEGTQLMLLKWMKENRKSVLDKSSVCFFCKDWLRYKLSGVVGADISDSGTSLLDIKEGNISDEILHLLELDEYKKLLPKPVKSDDVFSMVTEEAALKTGLKIGTKIITGGLDVSVSALGVGAIHEHDCCVIAGTTCATEEIVKKRECKFGEENSRYENHPLDNMCISLQPTMNGMPNFDWVKNEVICAESFAEMRKLVESEPVGSHGVMYLPYIGLAGERAPFHNPYARAGFFGININCKKSTLARAVYEGVSMSIKDCFGDINRNGVIYLAGGGSKDSVFAQMISDVMGMKVRIPVSKELGAKGICIMCLVRLGVYKNYEECVSKVCKYEAEYKPIAENTRKYDKIYEMFKSVRIAHMQLWNERHSLMKYL